MPEIFANEARIRLKCRSSCLVLRLQLAALHRTSYLTVVSSSHGLSRSFRKELVVRQDLALLRDSPDVAFATSEFPLMNNDNKNPRGAPDIGEPARSMSWLGSVVVVLSLG
jgi:hypothetical protein